MTKSSDLSTSVSAPTAIWNPNAAANWSILFTPAFGAYLHMRNWMALGNPDRAANARKWYYASVFLLGLYVFMFVMVKDSEKADALTRGTGFIFLIAWYFMSAREQARYVKGIYGSDYERRPWGKVLGVAVGALVAYWLLFFITALFTAVAR